MNINYNYCKQINNNGYVDVYNQSNEIVKGFFGTKIEGLASSNIKYEDAVKNIKMLREALVAMPRTAGLQTSQATNTAEGGTGNNTIVAPTVVDASVNDSSQPVTTITGRDSFNQPSYAQYV